MEYFLQTFGNVTIGKAALVIAAAAFMIACYKKVAKYFTEKALRDKEKDERIQQVIDQAQKYPQWHQQSIDIREQLNGAIKELSGKIDTVNTALEEMRTETGDERATDWRYRILRFNDEILHDERHTKEHFDQILEDVTKYEKYCKSHPNYSNNKAELAIKNIKRVYEKCTNENAFL